MLLGKHIVETFRSFSRIITSFLSFLQIKDRDHFWCYVFAIKWYTEVSSPFYCRMAKHFFSFLIWLHSTAFYVHIKCCSLYVRHDLWDQINLLLLNGSLVISFRFGMKQIIAAFVFKLNQRKRRKRRRISYYCWL